MSDPDLDSGAGLSDLAHRVRPANVHRRYLKVQLQYLENSHLQVVGMKFETNENYYRSFDLDFQCLDKEEVLRQADERLSDFRCHNMVVDFGPDNAYIGWDFDERQVGEVKESWKNNEQVGIVTDKCFNIRETNTEG